MRVTTSMIFNNGTKGLQDRQYDLYKLQNQLSTGRKILSPEDDPIGASEALQVSQSKGVNKQFMENQANAKAKLDFLDSTLENVSGELLNIYERTVQAGNGSYNASQRGMIAAELKQRMENLKGLANTQDGTGLYIFAGYQTGKAPFVESTGNSHPYSLGGPFVEYKGDGGKQTLQVTASKDVAASENGLDVFMQVKDSSGAATGRSVFDGLQNLIDILEPASGIPFDSTAYSEALGDMASAIDHVSTVRASVGARLQSLDSLTTTGEDVGYLYDVRLSELQDLDYASAISQFSNYKLQLDAAQLTFKQTSQLSLFNIL